MINTTASIRNIGKSSFVPASSPSLFARAFRSSKACMDSSFKSSDNPFVPFLKFCDNSALALYKSADHIVFQNFHSLQLLLRRCPFHGRSVSFLHIRIFHFRLLFPSCILSVIFLHAFVTVIPAPRYNVSLLMTSG